MIRQFNMLIVALFACTALAACSGDKAQEANALGFEDVTIGNASASVHVIEYASATCPACAFFHNDILPSLKADYIEPGKVKFTFREFPLDSVATLGFYVARCAPRDRYMRLIEAQFAAFAAGSLSGATARDAYAAFAEEQGIPADKFNTCLQDENILTNMRAMRDHGVNVDKVTGTPTLLINGKKYEGPLTVEDISAALDKALGAD
jgi:protein-disulfide isomerase